MPRFPGFINGTYPASSVLLDAQRTLNLYVETDESGAGKNAAALLGTPGTALFATLPTGPVRGILAAGAPLTTGARMFAVGGSKLYEVSSGGGTTLLGDVSDDFAHTPVQMAVNGNDLMVVSNGLAYIANGVSVIPAKFVSHAGVLDIAGTALTWVSGDVFDGSMVAQTIWLNSTPYTVASYTDSHHITLTASAGAGAGIPFHATNIAVPARSGGFLDGYFIVTKPDSKQFNISSINNSTGYWDPLDFGVKESFPDNIAMSLIDHEELWLFGDIEETEVWRNSGNPDFPFERVAVIQQGIAAAGTAVRLFDGVGWLGSDSRGGAVAWVARGYQPKRISTHAVEAAWAVYSTVADAVAYVYAENGHQFWVISFPTGGQTWVYDVTTQQWHERAYWTGSVLQRQRAQTHAFVFGSHLVGDYSSGAIYRMSAALYAESGTAMRRIRTAPHISEGDDWTFFARLRLDMENTGALNPSLDWSVDGGVTFGTARTTVSNAAGVFARYDWRRLGRSRDRVFRLTITSTLKVAICDAFLEVNSVEGGGAK